MPQIYYAADLIDAQLVHQYLEQHGIGSRVSGEMLSQAKGELPLGMATTPSVWVLDNDVATAKELIARFEQERAALAELPEWVCPACSSENPGNFDECWSCEQPRPASEELSNS